MMNLYSLSVVEVPSYQRIHHHINIVSCIIKSMSNHLSILLHLFCPPIVSCMHRHYSEFANSAAALMHVPTVAYSPLNILEVVWRLWKLQAGTFGKMHLQNSRIVTAVISSSLSCIVDRFTFEAGLFRLPLASTSRATWAGCCRGIAAKCKWCWEYTQSQTAKNTFIIKN